MLKRADIGIWLISLPQDQARRDRLGAQLDALDIGWTWFPAIDGRLHQEQLLRRADPDAYSRNMAAPIPPGKLGVYASHLEVWNAHLASPHKAALVLEDDTVLHDDFSAALDTDLGAAGSWEVVRFNSVRAKWPVRQARLGRRQHTQSHSPFPEDLDRRVHN